MHISLKRGCLISWLNLLDLRGSGRSKVKLKMKKTVNYNLNSLKKVKHTQKLVEAKALFKAQVNKENGSQ